MSKPVEIEEAKFDEAVLKAKIPSLVDFWAPWCGPCRMVAPVVDELAGEYDGKVGFFKLNVDNSPRVAGKYGVMSIPTLILFKNGAPVANIVGFRPKAELKKSLDAALAG
jgi:thioredoxin 1